MYDMHNFRFYENIKRLLHRFCLSRSFIYLLTQILIILTLLMIRLYKFQIHYLQITKESNYSEEYSSESDICRIDLLLDNSGSEVSKSLY